jgi:hypothetical protein
VKQSLKKFSKTKTNHRSLQNSILSRRFQGLLPLERFKLFLEVMRSRLKRRLSNGKLQSFLHQILRYKILEI